MENLNDIIGITTFLWLLSAATAVITGGITAAWCFFEDNDISSRQAVAVICVIFVVATAYFADVKHYLKQHKSTLSKPTQVEAVQND